MSECDSAASGVNVLDPKAENLGVGFDDCGEGFVELPNTDIRLLEAGLGEEFLYRCGRCNWEINGIYSKLARL
jgi:hypothetical protein